MKYLMDDFNPVRLTLARERRMFTKKALAETAGLSATSVSTYENHREVPTAQTLSLLAKALDYPESFFLGETPEVIRKDAVSFRSMARMKSSQRHAAIASGSLAMLFDGWIEAHFSLPAPDVPDLRDQTPDSAAETLRHAWQLGEQSIRNMIHLLELRGIRVFFLDEENKEVDAFSFWNGSQPFIFLNTYKSAERSRFDAAHELGHLVLHQHSEPQGKEAESEADRFASAFLMPEGSIRAYTSRFMTLDDLISQKKTWVVSLAALVRRLRDLGIISEWQYRSMNIEMSKRGFLKAEPEESVREKSQIINKILEALWREGNTIEKIAAELSLPVNELNNFLYGNVKPKCGEKAGLSLVV